MERTVSDIHGQEAIVGAKIRTAAELAHYEVGSE